MTVPPETFDVAILGFGPTGSTLVNLLGCWSSPNQKPISVLIIEQYDQLYALPRAVHFDDETMRVFQACGLANEVVKTTKVNKGMKFMDKNGLLILDWPRPQEITGNGWNASYRFHQPDLERILTKGVERFGNVTVKRGTKVLSITQHEDVVHVTCQTNGASQPSTFSAKYLVGCDGARSLTRSHIAKEAGFGDKDAMEDLGFQEEWLVIDVILKRPVPQLGEHTVQTCDPDRPMTFCCNPGDRRRWEIALREGEDRDTVSSVESVWKLIGPHVTPGNAELERRAIYTFESKVAKRWRSRRVFIAGDAAHLTPPFMGQGMCAGVRDASNLAWRLALAVSGQIRDTEALLDTYQSERRPHALAYVETALRLGSLINTCQTAGELSKCLGQAPSKANQEGGTAEARMESIKPELGPGLPGPVQRQICSQFKDESGRWSDDIVGYGFALLAESKFIKANSWVIPDDLSSTSVQFFGTQNKNERNGYTILTEETVPSLTAYLKERGVKGVVVRPDRYPLGAEIRRGKDMKETFWKNHTTGNLYPIR